MYVVFVEFGFTRPKTQKCKTRKRKDKKTAKPAATPELPPPGKNTNFFYAAVKTFYMCPCPVGEQKAFSFFASRPSLLYILTTSSSTNTDTRQPWMTSAGQDICPTTKRALAHCWYVSPRRGVCENAVNERVSVENAQAKPQYTLSVLFLRGRLQRQLNLLPFRCDAFPKAPPRLFFVPCCSSCKVAFSEFWLFDYFRNLQCFFFWKRQIIEINRGSKRCFPANPGWFIFSPPSLKVLLRPPPHVQFQPKEENLRARPELFQKQCVVDKLVDFCARTTEKKTWTVSHILEMAKKIGRSVSQNAVPEVAHTFCFNRSKEAFSFQG